MNEFFGDLWKYIRIVAGKNSKWIFLALDILGLLFIFVPELAAVFTPEYQWYAYVQRVGLVLILLSIFFGGFLGWRSLERRLREKPADLVMSVREPKFRFGTTKDVRNAIPMGTFLIDVFLSLRNNGDEEAELVSVNASQVQAGATLLRTQPHLVNLMLEGEKEKSALPLRVQPGAWNVRLLCRVSVGSFPEPQTKEDFLDLARRLPELDHFKIVLTYEFVSRSGGSTTRELTVEGDFAEFKRNIIQEWRNSKQEELVLAALEAGDLLDKQ